jgi:hypothetical protein
MKSICPAFTVSARAPVGLPVGIDNENDMLDSLKFNGFAGIYQQSLMQDIPHLRDTYWKKNQHDT